MQFAVISLFPEIIQNYFQYGVAGRAVKNNTVSISYYNPRDYSECKHSAVDDRPFGGGSGMILKPEPLGAAIDAAKKNLVLSTDKDSTQTQHQPPMVIYLSPQGKKVNQPLIKQYADEQQSLILLAGRYEGIDQRVIDKYVDHECSIGDYIISGGELAALVLMDAIIRLLPGVLGDSQANLDETFSDNLAGLLEYPQYTRPVDYCGLKVPDILQNGDHSKIHEWRHKQVLGRTWIRRPNLLEYANLTEEQERLLAEFKQEYAAQE